jgi:hypothetical protein
LRSRNKKKVFMFAGAWTHKKQKELREVLRKWTKQKKKSPGECVTTANASG